MRVELRARLWDIRDAIRAIRSFTSGKQHADYRQDPMLQAAVERKLEIIRGAHHIAKADQETASLISNYPRIIGPRHRLIHGYAQVDDVVVWSVVSENLPILLGEVEALLANEGDPLDG